MKITTRHAFIILAKQLAGKADNGPVYDQFCISRAHTWQQALQSAWAACQTNWGVNTKLESYSGRHVFCLTIYAEIEASWMMRPSKLLWKSLVFSVCRLKILGVYPASPPRNIKEPKSIRALRPAQPENIIKHR